MPDDERRPRGIVIEFHEVDELGPAHYGKSVRVHGWVKPGSIAERAKRPQLRFVLVRGQGEQDPAG